MSLSQVLNSTSAAPKYGDSTEMNGLCSHTVYLKKQAAGRICLQSTICLPLKQRKSAYKHTFGPLHISLLYTGVLGVMGLYKVCFSREDKCLEGRIFIKFITLFPAPTHGPGMQLAQTAAHDKCVLMNKLMKEHIMGL